MEEIKTKIKQTKARKKGFLKAMPDEQRRLLKMEERASKAAKRLLWCIPILLVLLTVAYIVITFQVSYNNKWVINAVICGALFIIGVIILLVARSSFKKKASAYGYSISDYVQEYGEIKQHISDLKKADKEQRAAQRKAAAAEEQARIASEKSAEKVRLAEEHAKVMQDNMKQASEHAASLIGGDAVSAQVSPHDNLSSAPAPQSPDSSAPVAPPSDPIDPVPEENTVPKEA